jgi:MoxR-like ATPase
MSAVSATGDERSQLLRLKAQLGVVMAGKAERLDLVLVALVCGGHILIEDVPGVGKTTLAKALAVSLGTDFGRIQFTADLLPADITGVEMFDPEQRRFVFHPGPVFHHIVLADEINRATPKAQSALLEAMAEGTVSIERDTHPLPDPFFVIATQNPLEYAGTFPLPESQLDRFFMRITLGYPDAEAERRVLLGLAGRVQLEGLKPVFPVAQLAHIRELAAAVPVSDALLDYVLALLAQSRNGQWLRQGVSPRAAQDLLAAAKARAWLAGQPYVSAADVQAVWLPVVGHRVVADGDAGKALLSLMEQVPVPA